MTIVSLREAADRPDTGGKARSLGRLLSGGFNVPDGFVVLAGDNADEAILPAYDRLAARYVAVRSSAVNEDGSDAAWAGQLDTFLNVSRDSLLERVHECVQSAESARAKAYAEQKGLAAGQVAVIVQAMVDSEVSGVAFSAHPVTKSLEQMVIEAGLGLGEAIVSGEITPDTYVLETASGKIVESFVSSQTKQLIRLADGKTEWQPIDSPANKAKLSPAQLSELAESVRKIAQHYGFPVDVEWAYAGGTLYILQARPITTLGVV